MTDLPNRLGASAIAATRSHASHEAPLRGLRPLGFDQAHEAIRKALLPAATWFVPVMGLIILIMGVTP